MYRFGEQDGKPVYVYQTARPAMVFDIMSVGGKVYGAQERDWGFVVPHSAQPGKLTDEWDVGVFARTILHEFTHQALQIAKEGVVPYWGKYPVQYATIGYKEIDAEKQGYGMDVKFAQYVLARYGVNINENKKVVFRW